MFKVLLTRIRSTNPVNKPGTIEGYVFGLPVKDMKINVFMKAKVGMKKVTTCPIRELEMILKDDGLHQYMLYTKNSVYKMQVLERNVTKEMLNERLKTRLPKIPTKEESSKS